MYGWEEASVIRRGGNGLVPYGVKVKRVHKIKSNVEQNIENTIKEFIYRLAEMRGSHNYVNFIYIYINSYWKYQMYIHSLSLL